MNIHIDKIRVSRDGPLAEDFNLDCGDLNLIYGHNESGKSYIVECLINSLFKTKTIKTKKSWNGQDLRPWDGIRAEVDVSGIDEGSISFTPKGKDKLESRWEDSDKSLPDDLAHLLVVKEGATWLDDSGATGQGVGINVLRNFLSEQKLLDGIQEGIPKILRKPNVSIVKGEPQGDQLGEFKKLKTLENKLGDLDTLVEDCNMKFSEGHLVTLEATRKQLQDSRSKMHKAKRHEAYSLKSSADKQKDLLDDIASGEEIGSLKNQIQNWEKDRRSADEGFNQLPQLQSQIDNHDYLKQVVKNYQNITDCSPRDNHPGWLLPLVLFFLLATIITGLQGSNNITTVLGIGTAALLGWHIFSSRKSGNSNQVANVEMEKLNAEYQRRFGEPVADISSLQAKTDKFNSQSGEARQEIRNYKADLKAVKETEAVISSNLAKLTGQGVKPDTWDTSIKSLENSRRKKEREIQQIEDSLRALGIAEDQYLKKDPGHAWDASKLAAIEQKLKKVKEEIDVEKDQTNQLRFNVRSVCNIKDETNWETLLEELRQKRDEVAEEYRSLKATIIGQILVNRVIEEMREDENNRIRSTLNDNSIKQCLQYFSRGYVGFHLTDDEQLEVQDSSGNAFLVSMLSSGAKEQVFLSLRVGFASRALSERSGFLLLDDAFQHSDWEQRSHMVAQCLKLVEKGWQVFYFTMDDHLNDLFREKGKSLGERFSFKTKELTRRQTG